MGAQCGGKLLCLLLCSVCLVATVTANKDSTCSVNDERQECQDRNDFEVDCIDNKPDCERWATAGECDNNPEYMLVHCRRSCNVCHYELDSNDFGQPQIIPPDRDAATREVIANSVKYMKDILADPKYASVRDGCRNNDRSCSQWAVGTGCEDNPKYMKMECSPACQSCDYVLEMKNKCAMDPNGKDAIEVGGMDALFERIVRTADYSNMQPTVLSRPTKKDEMNKDGTYASMLPCTEDITNPCGVHVGPWVVTLENFVSPVEIDTLLNWGAKMGYERSQAGDEVIEARTSSHAWCTDADGCYEDPIVKDVTDRIGHVTGIPVENFECLQLLKYTDGTYYRPHNDFIEKHVEHGHGPRLLTFFIYFNEVEKGGGTRFPMLNWPEGLQVEPKKGRVLIWPSVKDANILQEDKRTEHEAMPVEKGEKYAANAWVHTRDFQTPFRAGCPS